MSSVYKLTTNEGEFLILRRPTQTEMLAYVRHQLKRGYAYKDILYTWTVVPVRLHGPGRALIKKD